MPVRPSVFPTVPLAAHALLDSGGGQKLERFGAVTLARPDPQALWRRRLSDADWARADLTFQRESDRGGRWIARRGAPAAARGKDAHWSVEVDDLSLEIRPTPFKHVGLFPEQATNWAWVRERAQGLGDRPRLLNLFAYTGAATLAAARAGYQVTHVDASKTSVAWARANANASRLPDDAVRWIVEDALQFARREGRRGRKYHGVLLDPPHYGRGPKGEKWVFEEGLSPLLEACAELLEDSAFLVLSTYAIGSSPLAFTNLLDQLPGGTTEAGELVLRESEREGLPRRSLPCGFCARWRREAGA